MLSKIDIYTRMAIITLTSDLGIKDFYLPIVKGALYSKIPNANLVDLTHQITSFNIAQASFVVKNVYPHYPAETIHLISVDTGYTNNPIFLLTQYNDQYFIAPDNGIFSLLFDEIPEKVWQITIQGNPSQTHFPFFDVFVDAAVHLSAGGNPEDIGVLIEEVNQKALIQPIIQADLIRGTVVYIDSFCNVITNISRELFFRIKGQRNFSVYFRRNETISVLSYDYNEVDEGEKLCLFGISSHLEIAINKGKASTLLGFQLGDVVRVEFY